MLGRRLHVVDKHMAPRLPPGKVCLGTMFVAVLETDRTHTLGMQFLPTYTVPSGCCCGDRKDTVYSHATP